LVKFLGPQKIMITTKAQMPILGINQDARNQKAYEKSNE
jgi:hypothetical protein